MEAERQIRWELVFSHLRGNGWIAAKDQDEIIPPQENEQVGNPGIVTRDAYEEGRVPMVGAVRNTDGR